MAKLFRPEDAIIPSIHKKTYVVNSPFWQLELEWLQRSSAIMATLKKS